MKENKDLIGDILVITGFFLIGVSFLFSELSLSGKLIMEGFLLLVARVTMAD